MGLGNPDRSDDGFGVALAQELMPSKAQPGNGTERQLTVMVAGTAPERFLGRVADWGAEHLIFLDAVDFGGAPGAAVWLNAGEMAARYPQVSTHKLSLGLLARCVEGNGTAKVWLLGVQTESTRPGRDLSPAVQASLEALGDLLKAIWGPDLGADPVSHFSTGRIVGQASCQPAGRMPAPRMEVLA
jgi:hydrogenase 3 maturation protease